MFLAVAEQTISAYLDDNGRENVWDDRKEECVPIKLKRDDNKKRKL